MIDSLKHRTISGLYWSFIGSFAEQGVQFLVGIVLARLLSPREFGLIGMLTFFLVISQSFIEGGFRQALIRKQDCTDKDFSTVFYFNLAISIFMYVLLFFGAETISRFFYEPELTLLVRVLGVGVILTAFGIIQSTIYIKLIDFKTQTRVSVIASVASGVIAVGMAIKGFGVWSLVALNLSRFGFSSLLLWLWARWKPLGGFSWNSLKELFGFGSMLLLSSLLEATYRNVYYLVIGRYFSATQLGFYSRADQFQKLPSQVLTSIISRVTYPVLSSIQDDKVVLKASYKKLIRSTMLFSFVLMLGLAAVAKPLIITLIGEQWIPTAEYLELLCLVGMFYPLHALNLNILKVHGRSDLFLKLEILKKLLGAPTIIIGIFFGIKIMILGLLANNIIAYYLNSFWSGKLIGYPIAEQISDIMPSFLMAWVVSISVYVIGMFVDTKPFLILIIQITSGGLLTIGICEALRMKDYIYIKEILIAKLRLKRYH